MSLFKKRIGFLKKLKLKINKYIYNTYFRIFYFVTVFISDLKFYKTRQTFLI